MSAFLERKYLLAVAHRFDGFTQKSPNLYNCRCLFCGDSENKRKKRGYFYFKDNHWKYHCHNCGMHHNMEYVLKQLDYSLYEQYRLERFQNKKDAFENDAIFKSKVATQYDPDPATEELRRLPKISQLEVGHLGREYVVSRKIPNEMHTILRWCPEFFAWSNKLIPGKFEVIKDHGRVIIPFFSEENKFFAYVGRAVDATTPRYILIILNHNIPLIYGMNTVKRDKRVYAVEGPVDSMFLDNCIALGGSNLSVLTNLKDSDTVVVLDNEPHSKETKSKITHAIDLGYKVCIWPLWMVHKDINAMVLGGLSKEYIQGLIDSRTFEGLGAKIKLAEWSRI